MVLGQNSRSSFLPLIALVKDSPIEMQHKYAVHYPQIRHKHLIGARVTLTLIKALLTARRQVEQISHILQIRRSGPPRGAHDHILSPTRKMRDQSQAKRKATVKRPSLVLALSIFPGRRQPSIVDRNELNYRVRNGNGWTLILISTNSMSSSSRLKTTLLYCPAPLLSRLFVVTRTGFEPMLTA